MNVLSALSRRWRRDEGGQALLEFALVAPILIFLIFGIFAVGWWMNAQQIVTQAARQGARVGALTNANGQINGAIIANMAYIDPDVRDPGRSRTAVAIAPAEEEDPARRRGNPLTVQVTYTMPFSFDFLPAAFRSVRASVTTMIECVPPSGSSVCS